MYVFQTLPKKGVSYGRRGLSPVTSEASEGSQLKGKKVRPATAAARKVKSPSNQVLRPKTSIGNKRTTSGRTSRTFSNYIDSSTLPKETLPKAETFVDEEGRQSSIDVKKWVKAQADLSNGQSRKGSDHSVIGHVADSNKVHTDRDTGKSERLVKPWSLTELKQRSKAEKQQQG